MNEADMRANMGILARMSLASGQDPMMVGWVGEHIKMGIRFSAERPIHSLAAGAILSRLLDCEILVYVYEARRNVTPFVSPFEDPFGFTAIHALAWSDQPTVGWLSKLRREDDGTEWWDEIEPFDDIPPVFEVAVRPVDVEFSQAELVRWLQAHQHVALIY